MTKIAADNNCDRLSYLTNNITNKIQFTNLFSFVVIIIFFRGYGVKGRVLHLLTLSGSSGNAARNGWLDSNGRIASTG